MRKYPETRLFATHQNIPISFRLGNPVFVPSKLVEAVMIKSITAHLNKSYIVEKFQRSQKRQKVMWVRQGKG